MLATDNHHDEIVQMIMIHKMENKNEEKKINNQILEAYQDAMIRTVNLLAEKIESNDIDNKHEKFYALLKIDFFPVLTSILWDQGISFNEDDVY